MARSWTILLASLIVAAMAGAEVQACRPRPEQEALYEIAEALQRHVITSTTAPEDLRLNQLMRPEQLTGDQVHCSDFSLQFVTAKKHEWEFVVAYRPHLFGQPRAVQARITVFPYSGARDPSLVIDSGAPLAPYARSPWWSNSAWDGQFRLRQRDRTITGVAALLALPVGLAAGLIFAVWLARLRRHTRRKGAPSLGFMFALGSTFFVLVLGTLATPASLPIHWTLVAFLLPSMVVVSAGVVQLLFDRAHEWSLNAVSAGNGGAATPPSSWRIGMRSRIDDVAEGYRMSWSTNRFQ